MTEKELITVIEEKLKTTKDWMKGHDEAFLSKCKENDHELTEEECLELYQIQKEVLKKLLFEVDVKIVETKFAIKRKESK